MPAASAFLSKSQLLGSGIRAIVAVAVPDVQLVTILGLEVAACSLNWPGSWPLGTMVLLLWGCSVRLQRNREEEGQGTA